MANASALDENVEGNPWGPMLHDEWRAHNEVRQAADGNNYSWPQFRAWYGTAAAKMWARAPRPEIATNKPEAATYVDPGITEAWSTIRSHANTINIARRALTKDWAEYRQ